MSQQQCPWCGRLGPRYADGLDKKTIREEYGPHADGSPCVCRHVTCYTRRQAARDGGRYWDGARWVCMGGCGLAPADH